MIDQIPSKWATKLDNPHGHELWWDYVANGYFAWGKGVFLIYKNPTTDNHDRISGVDQYPEAQAPEGVAEKLVADCVAAFNAKLKEMFIDADHPVDQELYEALKAGLVWDGQALQFQE